MGEIESHEKMVISYESDNDMVYVDLRKLDTPEDVHCMWDGINREVKKSENRYIMVDISRSVQKTISNDSRKAFAEHMNEYNTFNKIAYIVTNPIIRMLLKATISAVDKNNIGRIFKTREEGLNWISKNIKTAETSET
jgi:hypothetical protein